MNRLRLVAAIFISLILTPTAASAFDIPLLTWERGRVQQVLLGGGAYADNWKVTLEGNGVAAIPFVPSSKNDAGYIVYTITLAGDFPTGSYSIVTNGEGSPRTVVAGVSVIGQRENAVTNNLFDLTMIVAIFAFLTSIVSTIRARKYSFIPLRSTQILPRLTDAVVDEDENFWDRLEQSPYRLRIQAITSLKPSLLRFLLIREGELVHRISAPLYGVMPLLGLVAGAIASIEVGRNGGLAMTPMTIFIAVLLLSIFDSFAGIFATLGFWALQIFTGDVTSFRDVLISLAFCLSWVGPGLFASLLRQSINSDFPKYARDKFNLIRYIGALGSALVGVAVFYLGQTLVNSIIYTDHQIRELTPLSLLIIFIALTGRGVADIHITDSPAKRSTRDESFFIARTNSPATAIAITATLFAFIYIWTATFKDALSVAVLFSLPYYFAFIRFDRVKSFSIEKLKRNILLEALAITAITFVIFRQISQEPLLVNQRAQLLLLLAGIAPLIHSIYSAFYSSHEDKFTFEEKSEIIKP